MSDRSRESSLWRWLKKGVSKKDADMNRLENGVGSHPDVEGCRRSKQFWLELKIGEITADGRIKTKFQPLQRPWLKRRWSHGGWAWVLLRVGSNHYLIRGCDLDTIFEGTEVAFADPEALENSSAIWLNAKPIEIIKAAIGEE